MPVDVLNGRLVTPHDLLARQPKNSSNTIPLGWTRRPAPQRDRQGPLFIQPAAFGELAKGHAVLLTQFGNGLLHDGIPQGVRPNCGPWPYRCETGLACPKESSSIGTFRAAAIRSR